MCEQITIGSFMYKGEERLTVRTDTMSGELKEFKHYPLYPKPHYTHHIRTHHNETLYDRLNDNLSYLL